MQAGQLAANNAKTERTDAKLEQQVGALEVQAERTDAKLEEQVGPLKLPTNIFTHVEFHSDTVCLESVAIRFRRQISATQHPFRSRTGLHHKIVIQHRTCVV